ncbi:MAG: PQQ-binding-like beta-propeller repeat protein [Pirellulales bacterium]
MSKYGIVGKIGLACSLVALCSAAEWRQFRGTDQRAVVDGAKLPLSFGGEDGGGENVAWKSPLVGKSASSPIVVGGKVIVTTSSGTKQDRLHVLAFDAATGKSLWQREFWATGRTMCHNMSAVAAPTPASDGERIFAFYSSNDLACLDLDGNLLWYRGLGWDYPQVGNDAGMSSSPVVAGNTVIVQVEAQGDAFAAGLDVQTGETRWRHERKKQAAWSSPAVIRGETAEQDAVLIQSVSGLTVHDPYTGRERAKFEANCAGIASSTANGTTVFVPSGGITALRFDTAMENPEVLWQENRLNPNSCSPVVDNGNIYTVNRTVLVAGDAATGKVKWQMRLPQGMYWSTPVLSGNHLYVFSYEGIATIVEVGDKQGKVVFERDLGERILGTPAVVGNALFLQTDKHLWKIEAAGK